MLKCEISHAFLVILPLVTTAYREIITILLIWLVKWKTDKRACFSFHFLNALECFLISPARWVLKLAVNTSNSVIRQEMHVKSHIWACACLNILFYKSFIPIHKKCIIKNRPKCTFQLKHKLFAYAWCMTLQDIVYWMIQFSSSKQLN